jgi:adenine-specific DNA-methyltransferase
LRAGSFVVENGVTREAVTLAAAWTQKGQMQAFYYGDDDVFDTRGQKVVEFYFSSTGKLKYRKERTALTPSTVQRWGTQGSASGAQAEILGAGVFDLPKPVALVQDVVSWCTHGSDLVLDFFAGSGTTAHAVALQNAADGARRRFICVNLPEPTPAGSPARSAGFETVSAITERRIRKVMETVEGASDTGLRVQRLASSNFRDATSSDPEELFDLRESTLVDGEHVMEYIAQEVLLKEGVRLDATWERHKAADAPVIVAEGVAVVMSLDLTEEIADAALALNPKVVVFLEDGFAGADAVKANAFTNAKNAGIVMKTV